MSDPVIRSIPLDRLELSPANVRRTAAGKTAFAELKASIAAHGLLENLVVRPLGPGQEGADRYAVIAGGRRLSALTDLVAEDVLAGDCPVPCRVIDNGTADNELSLAENVVRVAMHPADQVQAFGALAHDGATVADIAARFGASERIVEQRLRLGNAAPELLDAYRADEIDLETLKSFAVTTDRARQMAVWEQVREQGYRPSGWQIKRMLTEDRVPATAVTARFVGVETYEDAGGIVDRDLFADEDERGIWLADPVLLDKLASDRLQAAADELATRWNWAEARLDIDWSDLARFGRVQPQPAQPTPEEKAEAERLQVRHDELVNMDDDEWTEELVAEGDTIETRLDEIDAAIEARAVYRPEDIAIAGCIVTVGRDGNLQLVQGLVRPEDMPPPEQRADTAPGDATAESGATAGIQAPAFSPPPAPPSRQDAETQARKEAGVGIGLADDLRAIRTTLVKAHLAQDFGAAFDLMLFQMGRAVFTPGYHDHALDIAVRETPDRPPLRANDDAFADVSPGEAMLADRSSLPFDWLTMEDEGDAFSALRALSHDDKKRLFAACVARTVKGQLAFEHNARPELEATVARLDIDFASHVRPNAEMFWSRVRKDLHPHRRPRDPGRRMGIGPTARTRRPRWRPRWRPPSPPARGCPLGVTKDGRAAALAWSPPGFHACDRGRADDGKDVAAEADPPPAAQSGTSAAEAPAGETPLSRSSPTGTGQWCIRRGLAGRRRYHPGGQARPHLRGREHRLARRRRAPRRGPHRAHGD